MKLMLLLQKPGNRLTVEELASQFGVSKRTIFRDFNALQEINVPITWDKYSGYGVLPGYKIPPMMFTSKELATIMVGINFVKSQIDRQLVEDARGVELKIKNVLPEELVTFMTSLAESTIVDPYLQFGAEKTKGGNWYLISSAIAQQHRVQFRYTSKKGESKTRKIDPYILVFFQDHWNMIGFSHLRGEFRNFVLERVSALEILDENFERKPNVDTDELIYRFDGRSHLIELLVQKKEIGRLERNLPAKIFRREEKNIEEIKVGFEFDNLTFMNEWLLQFGKAVKIVGPEELKEKRKELLREMLK
ncbi:MAG: YafY family protein [Bacteroidota bacterium]